MPPNDAVIALNRFGLGARPGDVAAIASDPRGALAAELNPEIALLQGPDLPGSGDELVALRQLQMDRKAARTVLASAPANTGQSMTGTDTAPAAKLQLDPNDIKPNDIYLTEVDARIDRVLSARIGFTERLVAFWANHFAVKIGSGEAVRVLAGAFEREAIRPYVFAKFADMLVAVTQHPAMLAYLNNETSVGPDSRAGVRNDRGLNENHARELMELHTIGVNGGYTQADVTNVANILSGWSFSRGGNDANPAGAFVFRANAHEPGPRTIMGKVYDEPGERQGLALLADLAAAPATASHIARELAQAFVADDPPQPLVDALAATFTDTHGDLLALSRALITNDAAWQGPGRFRTPQEYMWASVRALDVRPKTPVIAHALSTLGQAPWDPPSPAGFDLTTATWLAPDQMTSRLDVAEQLAELADPTRDPAGLADDLFGNSEDPKTREAVARAESQKQGLALLLMSPDFQRI